MSRLGGGRRFLGALGGGEDNWVSIGDLAYARYLHAAAWSQLCFVRQTANSGDQRCPISKDGTYGQYHPRLQNSSAPHLEVWVNGNRFTTTGTGLALLTWYVMAVTHTAAGNLYAWVLNMDASIQTSGSGTTVSDAAGLTDPIRIGQRRDFDPFQGDIAHVLYVMGDVSDGGTLTEAIKKFAADPWRMADYWANRFGVAFHLPLGSDTLLEPDYSPYRNYGVVYNPGDRSGMGPRVGPPVNIMPQPTLWDISFKGPSAVIQGSLINGGLINRGLVLGGLIH